MTTGMRVLFSEGSRLVQDVSIYFGGMGPTTVSASRTCAAIALRSEVTTLQEHLASSGLCSLLAFVLHVSPIVCVLPPGGSCPAFFPSTCPPASRCSV